MAAILSAFQASSSLQKFLAPTGATGETVPAGRTQVTGDSGPLVSGTMYAMAIALPSGTVINNLTFFCGNTAESTGTHLWYAFLDNGRVVRAVTADQTGATAMSPANTPVTFPVTAAYTTTYSGLYYMCIACVATGTPSVGQCGVFVTGLIGLTPLLCGNLTGFTTPPTLGTTIGALTAYNGALYGYTS